MSTLNNQLFIDAIVVHGVGRVFSASVKQATEETATSTNPVFEPIDLSGRVVRFRILGSASGAGTVLIEKIIGEDTDAEKIGFIEDPSTGEFTFAVTAQETLKLGVGVRPISLEILDAESLERVITLTEGGTHQGEFNKIQIVRV